MNNYIMRQKKILFLNAKWLGDSILWIPKLVELRKKGYKVYQSYYDERYFTWSWPKGIVNIGRYIVQKPKISFMLDILKREKLIDEILEIPFWIIILIVFLIKNFKKFDEIILPIKTRPGIVLGKILWKVVSYSFESTNDTSKYRNIIEGITWLHINALYDYHTYIHFDEEKIILPENYIVIAPSMMERSLLISEWLKIIDYLLGIKYSVVIIWSEREQWFIEEIKKEWYYDKVIDSLWKTSFSQLIYIIKHAKIDILCDGWLLWLGNLINKHNINIHTSNGMIFEPPVDNKNSFNVRIYDYPNCTPCSARDTKQQNTGKITQCVFYWTKKEWMCRKVIKSEIIIDYIKKHL